MYLFIDVFQMKRRATLHHARKKYEPYQLLSTQPQSKMIIFCFQAVSVMNFPDTYELVMLIIVVQH